MALAVAMGWAGWFQAGWDGWFQAGWVEAVV
jgi:hypothetical protein